MKADGRALDHAALTELRKRGVAAVQAGESPSSVAAALGVNPRTVFRWLALSRQSGRTALEARKRGGRPSKLDGQALRRIASSLMDQPHLRPDFPFALWTAAMVQALVLDTCGVPLSRSSTSRLLHQWGVSAPRPLARAHQHDPELVRHWLAAVYPAIQQRAKRESAQIFFVDDADLSPDFPADTAGRKRAPAPAVPASCARSGGTLISAVAAQGELRFMIAKGPVTAAVFVEFLTRLLVKVEGPVFVIADGSPIHRARSVGRFVSTQQGRLAVFTLPPSSPALTLDGPVGNGPENHGMDDKAVTCL